MHILAPPPSPPAQALSPALEREDDHELYRITYLGEQDGVPN